MIKVFLTKICFNLLNIIALDSHQKKNIQKINPNNAMKNLGSYQTPTY